MIVETIDLYDYFQIERRGDGGILTICARSPIVEIREKLRPGMLVIPGGGYAIVSKREREPIMMRYLEKGYVTASLVYTCNTTHPTPLIEAGMAMVYLRENAKKYGLDVAHLGAIGFSAGGHLTGCLATLHHDEVLKKTLGKRVELVRPDAVVLCYPVISTTVKTHGGTAQIISGGNQEILEHLSLEKRVDKDSSPAFIWHTRTDDCVPAENALMLASAYQQAGVAYDLHIFDHGWHGLSTVDIEVNDTPYGADVSTNVGKWLDLSFDFLKDLGFAVKTV